MLRLLNLVRLHAVAPVRERGLKSLQADTSDDGQLVAPVRERGLKSGNGQCVVCMKLVAPVRERGLKSWQHHKPV